MLSFRVLSFLVIQSLYHEIQNHSKAEGPPFQFFRHYGTFPAPFLTL